MGTVNFREAQYGLTTEIQRRINALLQAYNAKLSLRRIPEMDPAAIAGAKLNPPKTFGVWEENVDRDQSNWVFTLAEMSIDDRILRRIWENDFANAGADKRMARLLAENASAEMMRERANEEKMDARREEMMGIGKMAQHRDVIRHRINGEDFILGDTLRPVSVRVPNNKKG